MERCRPMRYGQSTIAKDVHNLHIETADVQIVQRRAQRYDTGGAAQQRFEADKTLASLGFCSLNLVRWPDRGESDVKRDFDQDPEHPILPEAWRYEIVGFRLERAPEEWGEPFLDL